MFFNGGDDFEIYKIEAETGSHTISGSGTNNPVTITNFAWDGNNKTVWQEEASNRVTLHNPSNNPNTTDPYDNLQWNENKEAILLRVYVRTIKKEGSLRVVYHDEKFNDTLYAYNIPVGVDDNNNLVTFDSITPTPDAFADNAERIDVTGCSIVNIYGAPQYFQTDLTKVPEAKGKYNSELYTYTGSKISDDGKTLYLYYNINTTVLKPNFVVDFGLPITFNLREVTESPDLAKTVTASARYGTVDYNAETKVFTYKPTKILQNIDVISVNILFDGEQTTSTTNVGVTPATTVYYEESFLTYDSNWDDGHGNEIAMPSKTQKTEILGSKSSIYGYDAAYADDKTGSNGTKAVSTANGATASFTFTGTGFELYANSLSGENASGIVTVYSQGTTEGTVSKLYMIDTALTNGETGATNNHTKADVHYGLPIISENSLPHGTYTVQLRQTNGDEVIYIDGVRIINTIKDSSIYKDDLEDNPEFYELRNAVMAAVGWDFLQFLLFVFLENNVIMQSQTKKE